MTAHQTSSRKTSNALVGLAGLAMACGTVDSPSVRSDDANTSRLGTARSAIHAYTSAHLEIRVKTGGSRYCDATPLKLCIGNNNQCYDLVEDGSGASLSCRTGLCYDGANDCLVGGYASSGDVVADDHPFVAHPDDWDRVYLLGKVPFTLASVRFRAQYFTATTGTWAPQYKTPWDSSVTPTPRMVDQSFDPARLPSSTPSGSDHVFDLSVYLRQNREGQMGALASIGAANFGRLPGHLRAATQDLWQAGMFKYDPADRTGQNGCNEFVGTFNEEYSTAADYACADCLHEGDGPALQHGKLYKLFFDVNGKGERTALNGIHLCKTAFCAAYDANVNYAPKVGDALLARWSSGGDGHAMMIAGGFDGTRNGDVLFSVPVIELNQIVRMNLNAYKVTDSPSTEWYVIPVDAYTEDGYLFQTDANAPTEFRPWWSRAEADAHCKSIFENSSHSVKCQFDGAFMGYQLYFNGTIRGYEPGFGRSSAVTNCQWNKQTYPNKFVECRYAGNRLGYELFRDGQRAGFEPTWTKTRAVENCQWNKQTYPNKVVKCTFDGAQLGYELFRDGQRVGFEPAWSNSQAVENCQRNKQTYPNKFVECTFDGAQLGYELFWDGQRVGFEPTWTKTAATDNCQWNKDNKKDRMVQCRYGGKSLGYELFWNGTRRGFEPKWTKAQAVDNCIRNLNTYLDKDVKCTYDGRELFKVSGG